MMSMLLRHNAKQFARGTRILVAGAHLPFRRWTPPAADQGYAWVPVNYRWREL